MNGNDNGSGGGGDRDGKTDISHASSRASNVEAVEEYRSKLEDLDHAWAMMTDVQRAELEIETKRRRAMSPSWPPITPDHSDHEIEKLRAHAREKDELISLEVRLLGNAVRKQTAYTGKIVDLLQDMQQHAPITDAMLAAIRENRDAALATTQTITVEMPQLLAMIVTEVREIKESIQAIAAVVIAKGTNGHLQEGSQ